jgi:hypothetical protein
MHLTQSRKAAKNSRKKDIELFNAPLFESTGRPTPMGQEYLGQNHKEFRQARHGTEGFLTRQALSRRSHFSIAACQLRI